MSAGAKGRRRRRRVGEAKRPAGARSPRHPSRPPSTAVKNTAAATSPNTRRRPRRRNHSGKGTSGQGVVPRLQPQYRNQKVRLGDIWVRRAIHDDRCFSDRILLTAIEHVGLVVDVDDHFEVWSGHGERFFEIAKRRWPPNKRIAVRVLRGDEDEIALIKGIDVVAALMGFETRPPPRGLYLSWQGLAPSVKDFVLRAGSKLSAKALASIFHVSWRAFFSRRARRIAAIRKDKED